MPPVIVAGTFDPDGRPSVKADIQLPTCGVQEGAVRFMVDTGADWTLLVAKDAVRLGVNPLTLPSTTTLVGIGGPLEVHLVFGDIGFSSGSRIYWFRTRLAIMNPNSRSTLPSLLGRDLLKRIPMTYDAAQSLLTLDVQYADFQ